MEMGKSPIQAAQDATEELSLAILATSLSLMAVFVPIGSMGEVVGQYFKQFGLTVAFALAFSTMAAYTLTPNDIGLLAEGLSRGTCQTL